MIMEPKLKYLEKFGPSDFVNLINDAIPYLIGLEGFKEKWYSVEKYLTDTKEKSSVRSDLLEVSLRARAQCMALGMLPAKSEELCWLCGLPFKEQLYHIFPLQYAQCEHVLPSAIGYLTVGIPTDIKSTDESTINFLKHNYSWAHAECNRIKRDAVFLTIINENYQISPSNEIQVYNSIIEKYLKNVWKDSSPISPVGQVREKNEISFDDWKKNAKNSILTTLEPLIELLKRGTSGVTLLLNVNLLQNTIDKIYSGLSEEDLKSLSTSGPMRINRKTPAKTERSLPFYSPDELRSPYKPRIRKSTGGQKRNITRRRNR